MSFKKHSGLSPECIYTEVPGVGMCGKQGYLRSPFPSQGAEDVPGGWGPREGKQLTSHCVQPLGGICTNDSKITMLPVYTAQPCAVGGNSAELRLRSLGLEAIS